MRNEDNSTLLAAHFSDVWADAQRSRSAIFKSLVLKAWRLIQTSDATPIWQRQAAVAAADSDGHATSASNG